MTQPPRILALTVRADIGGGPEHLYQLTKAYGNDVETIIACPQDRPYFDRYCALENVAKVVEIPHRAFKLGALFQLRKLVKDQRIDLIHSHGKGAGLYGRLLAVLSGKPCVHTFHGLHVGEYGSGKKAIYLALESLLSRMTRAAIAVSEGEATQIDKAGIIAKAKLTVVENGVVVPDQITHAPQQQVLQVIAVNRYDHQKHPELLLDIAARLKAANAPVFITVIGQGEQFEACAARANAEGLQSHVALAGPTDTPREALRYAQVFLSTSRWEGMPLAVLEAMSEGLCPVLTDVVGNRDVIEDGSTGLLYPDGDAQAGADHLIALSNDPKTRSAMGENAHQSAAQNYSTQRMAAQTLTVYRAVLEPAMGRQG